MTINGRQPGLYQTLICYGPLRSHLICHVSKRGGGQSFCPQLTVSSFFHPMCLCVRVYMCIYVIAIEQQYSVIYMCIASLYIC